MTIIQSKEMMCFSLVSFFVVGFCYLSTKQNYFLSLSIYICVYTIFLLHRNEHTDILLSFPSSFLFIFPYLFFSVVHRKQNEFIVPIDDKKEESICPLLIFLASWMLHQRSFSYFSSKFSNCFFFINFSYRQRFITFHCSSQF